MSCCFCFGSSRKAKDGLYYKGADYVRSSEETVSSDDEVRRLDYRHCSLLDVPPEVFAYERTLEELRLDANQIAQLPPSLFHCHGIKYLGLSDNELQSLPPAISSLANLEELDVNRNGLADLPDTLRSCKRLRKVDASANPLGKTPDALTQLVALEELHLNDTLLEYLPANLGRLCKLRSLELRENRLTTLPKSLARLAGSLRRLDVGQNDLCELPDVSGDLTSLAELWCDCNRLRALPKTLGRLRKLRCLDATSNCIAHLPDEIGDCGEMIDLSLTTNEIRVLPQGIGRLKSLTTLRLDDNRLSELPSSIGSLSQLEELYLNVNRLKSLPQSIGLLRKLQVLLLDDNRIESFPAEIGSCQNLSILSVRANRLVDLPAEVGNLKRLRVVNVSGNRLRCLPVSVMKLDRLCALWLADNQAKPLVPLQREADSQTGQWVLTCYLLPQVIAKPASSPSAEPATTPCKSSRRKPREVQIKFATDYENGDVANEPNGRELLSPTVKKPIPSLTRAPTPYPRELKAMAAKHAQRMGTSPENTTVQSTEDPPASEPQPAPEGSKDYQIVPSPVTSPAGDGASVKTSTVTKTATVATSPPTPLSLIGANGSVATYRGVGRGRVHPGFTLPRKFGASAPLVGLNRPAENERCNNSAETATLQVYGTTRIRNVDPRPAISEARCVRNSSSADNIASAVPQQDGIVLRPVPVPPARQPPPYHLAAVHSKLYNNSLSINNAESTVSQSLKEYL